MAHNEFGRIIREHRQRQLEREQIEPQREFERHQTEPQRDRFSRGLSTILEYLRTFFSLIFAYLPHMLAVGLYILIFFTDSDGSVKLLMIIPCGIVLFTGWKGLIGLVILAGIVRAC